MARPGDGQVVNFGNAQVNHAKILSAIAGVCRQCGDSVQRRPRTGTAVEQAGMIILRLPGDITVFVAAAVKMSKEADLLHGAAIKKHQRAFRVMANFLPFWAASIRVKTHG